MAVFCKGIFVQYKGSIVANGKKYDDGQKWCSRCSVFIYTEKSRCPCCKNQLRRTSFRKKIISNNCFQ